jgi:hypothetical protein
MYTYKALRFRSRVRMDESPDMNGWEKFRTRMRTSNALLAELGEQTEAQREASARDILISEEFYPCCPR